MGGHGLVKCNVLMPGITDSYGSELVSSIQTIRSLSLLSLPSLRPMCLKAKLKVRMAWIEETNSDPYESVIPGIKTLHFTRSSPPISIAFLGRNQIYPMPLQG